MKIIDFLNQHEDWESILSSEPYNLKIKRDGDYMMLSYDFIDSDFSLQEVRESRGPIFTNKGGKWVQVCQPFRKFFNYGEQYAADIDWNSATVKEKVDGSLMKLWWDWDGGWHLSTNGTIDAFKAKVADFGVTFGDLFERALGIDIDDLGGYCTPGLTYLFELTTPESQVVIPYEDGVYLLAIINQYGIEQPIEEDEVISVPNLKVPKEFLLSSLDDVIEVVSIMSKDEEGVVVSDNWGNRIKVKSPQYLAAAHLINNGAVTEKRLINYIIEEKIDDFISYAPQYEERVNSIKASISALEEYSVEMWNWIMSEKPNNRKEFALLAKQTYIMDFLFQKYDNEELDFITYFKGCSENKRLDMIHRIAS